MNKTIKLIICLLGAGSGGITFPLLASDIALPDGFEDIFDARQNGVFNIIYTDISIASIAVEFDRREVRLLAPSVIVEQITAEDMPALTLSKEALLEKLSAPLMRVGKEAYAEKEIVASLDESDASLRLIFPASYFKAKEEAYERTYVPYRNQAGFVHSHNLNYLSDSYSDSLSVSAVDTLNLTGNSYIKGAWSYAEGINFNLDELALNLEHNNTRFKAGRQRLTSNLDDSTPSMNYSFYNSVSYDGVSLGYMLDGYLDPGNGAATPVTVYLPQAGTVEVYRSGRLIDLQQFPAGLQRLNTDSWPSGGYDVTLVAKLNSGSREEKVQPFFKRNGRFRSGDIEYLAQMGRYDQRRGALASRTFRGSCNSGCDNYKHGIGDNYFANLSLGYTTESAFSFGGGVLMDNETVYGNASMDIPVNSWFAQRLYADAVYGDENSFGYQVGLMKNIHRFGLNVSYRDNRYRGEESEFRRFGIVPTYDFDYLQFGVSANLPWNVGLGVTYGLNTLYQDYGRQQKSEFESWDVTLNRDFMLSNMVNLRVDLGYHRGVNEFTSLYSNDSATEDRIFAQLTLGLRERSYNHYQSLYLRSRFNDDGSDKNLYSADYTLDLDNPEFDRGGRYSLNASYDRGPGESNSAGAGVSVDNRYGYSAAGITKSFGNNNYSQLYLSQRSGFAIGDGEIALGRMGNTSALIVDARDLPEDQYFEVRNLSGEPVVVKGGQKTTMGIAPYQKVTPKAEQMFTGKTDAFYNLTTQSTTTWARPGQVYQVKISATKNQTVTGRLYYDGQPMANARVVGGNAMSDEEGLFVGDFTLKTDSRLESLTVNKEGQVYICPLLEQNVRVAQGIMQIREVNCEIQ
ncbi:putative outer membrane usher protein EcpC [Mixta theicola]|nr:putative outer membrane usher protein EcpC [Mixta theicola]